ncbi:Uma2 family endonuclease [Streptomyces sp. N2-109]|uniref:Uma2 family endonuclease n=1 Tax=Streptomyces gossypii TaxID=2883101 RepID=A0ABT2JYI6_9ACTN|nr:Uma2 family endonuclease [Streptomyces gossypii]MCT2592964.1 Uma2 family endonuclease [Streptomyces gossypii]MCT2593697.1 Uma2 family endonuclease [Streptomyces gossypii]
MADADTSGLEEELWLLDRMRVPEGFKAEIVEGAVVVSPQRKTHWKIIELVLLQLKERYGRRASTLSDVLLALPGEGNGFAPDLLKLSATAEAEGVEDRWTYRDVEFVLEVISRETGDNDYGRKRKAYALAGIPVYLIADPYTGKCHAFGRPDGEAYDSELTVKFGEDLDLSPLGMELRLETDDFPRD